MGFTDRPMIGLGITIVHVTQMITGFATSMVEDIIEIFSHPTLNLTGRNHQMRFKKASIDNFVAAMKFNPIIISFDMYRYSLDRCMQ